MGFPCQWGGSHPTQESPSARATLAYVIAPVHAGYEDQPSCLKLRRSEGPSQQALQWVNWGLCCGFNFSLSQSSFPCFLEGCFPQETTCMKISTSEFSVLGNLISAIRGKWCWWSISARYVRVSGENFFLCHRRPNIFLKENATVIKGLSSRDKPEFKSNLQQPLTV
jgi:hypothetical protein